ncbi:uncharacterized protein L969DRAFT_99455 [Mixia osmundae IAM 14324]|uniref:Tetrapyrrole methylase domain-containing protein n=1 Tax=Mixia osmundae (strain CBS 9802 / IAM 14324 / JCM 22182 / KY 12970) TaxID=764103 RepID=G7E7I6_MIXOS|nr:uncharacterized protein L969DRAFT_99455 [Mixia osmundae IAM 14324]KEI38398.1 hypothetical protein L969DRAFT_99455 [Mixia osmundae IAM 14324]GAA98796.1 hypothetical protein E5Q_05484 [Mixia osmundae IAM 14324]
MSWPKVYAGASVLLACSAGSSETSEPRNKRRRTVLVIGSGRLAAIRSFAFLEAGYSVLLACDAAQSLDAELSHRIACNEVAALSLNAHDDFDGWLDGNLSQSQYQDLAMVIVTDTLYARASSMRSLDSARSMREACYERRIPVNIADQPSLSDFAFPASHRWGDDSPLQMALTTNQHACKLASRLKRMLVTALPRDAGQAVVRIGKLRQQVRSCEVKHAVLDQYEEVEEGFSSQPLNMPVRQMAVSSPRPSRCTSPNRTGKACVLTPQLDTQFIGLNTETRMRFISQISEYWPIERLAQLDAEETTRLLGLHSGNHPESSSAISTSSARDHSHVDTPSSTLRHHDSAVASLVASPLRSKGLILLVGSGTGSPSLLTVAAHRALTQMATVVLSDKIVPEAVLALVPKSTKLIIARKFPGNAESAQEELMRLALEYAGQGHTVVRLKQGSPYLYGRGGEEVLHFRKHGYECLVVPGVSSSLDGPTMAGIPVTQRGVADTLTICTGVGRRGKGVVLPGYERTRTLSILMGVARLVSVVETLTQLASDPAAPPAALEPTGESLLYEGKRTRSGTPYPPYLPIAIIERASSSDQRVIASTLDRIVAALQRHGEPQRPPGMMVIGWAVLSLDGEGDISMLDDMEALQEDESLDRLQRDAAIEAADRARIDRWLAGETAIVREGLPARWSDVFEASL